VRESFPGRRLVLAFQPHRYTRTRDLFEDFVRVLSQADAVILAEVYPAGEAPIVAADGRALTRALRVAGRVEAGLRRRHRRPAGSAARACSRRRHRGDDGRGFDRRDTATTGVTMMALAKVHSFRACADASRTMPRSSNTRAGAREARQTRCTCRRTATISRISSPQLHASEPLLAIGLGSNTLVRDGGVRGTVVVMHNPGAALAVTDGLIYADAGLACPKLARFAANHGCAEAEFLAGIPGTVGGALAMNGRLLRRRNVAFRGACRSPEPAAETSRCEHQRITQSDIAA
jgi:hypothetical protein